MIFFFRERCYRAILDVKTTRELGRGKPDFKGEADKFKIEEGEEEEKIRFPSSPPPPSPFFKLTVAINVPMSFC